MIRFLIPFILFFLFMGESVFSSLAGEWFYSEYIFSPKFVYIGLLFLAFYGPKNYYFSYAIIFGLLVDIVYSEIIGIYLVSYPATLFIVHLLKKVLQSNYFIMLIVSIFGLSLIEIFSFVINTVVKINTMSVEEFLFVRLLPTLIFNLIFVLISMWPLRKMAEKVKLLLEK